MARVSFRLPDNLLEYVDQQCQKLTTEYQQWDRSTFFRYLVSQHKHGKKVKSDSLEPQGSDENYMDLLNLAGYRKG
ncbi:hypothetical protein [Desulfotomaculum sp. 1211_IL3151]|uniref:hypothetical protein n=1 Tax=Desulfotomaculum sp. 1211_IL3151 TaxID=3084055 RepID=UPI002FDA4A03